MVKIELTTFWWRKGSWCWRGLSSSTIEFGEKKLKTRAIMPFKVIQGHRGRYQSKARMRLLISD